MFEPSLMIANVISDSYDRKPVITFVFILIGIIVLVIFGVFAFKFYIERDFEQSVSKDIAVQIQELEKFDIGLKKLAAFITIQKEQLTHRQAVIKELEKERNNLEPIVNSQSEVVEAIFKAQERRVKKDRWIDIIVGLFVGIAASFIASVIMKIRGKRLF